MGVMEAGMMALPPVDVPFACNLVVKTAQRDAKRLQSTEWPLVVHCERVLAHAAELHHHMVSCEASVGQQRKARVSKRAKQRQSGKIGEGGSFLST